MLELFPIFLLLYFACTICVVVASNNRQCNMGFIVFCALVGSPLFAALVLLAHPSKEEIAYYKWLKKQQEKE